MRVAVLGEGPPAAARMAAINAFGQRERQYGDVVPTIELIGTFATIDRHLPQIDVLFATGGTLHHTQLSELAQRGCHLFLEWPPARSVVECEALARLSEEAGIEIGVSRPLRFVRWPESAARLAHVDVLSVRQTLDVRTRGQWKRALEDAVDLTLAFTRGAAIRRVDVAAARDVRRLPLVTSASLRFQNRTFAQIEVRHGAASPASMLVGVAGPGYAFELDLSSLRDEALACETGAFLEAVAANRTPPVSVLDALQTIRLLEKLMERLRR